MSSTLVPDYPSWIVRRINLRFTSLQADVSASACAIFLSIIGAVCPSFHTTCYVAATSHLPFAITENYHSPCRAPVEPSAWNFPLKLATHVKCKAHSDTLSFQCPSTLTSRIIKDLIATTQTTRPDSSCLHLIRH